MGAQTMTWGVPVRPYSRLLEVAETLATMDIQGFETNYMSLEKQASHATQCQRDFEARHVRLIAPHCDSWLYHPSKVDKEITHLQRIAAYSKAMGASHFIISGEKLPQKAGQPQPSALATKIAALNRLGGICHNLGLKFCYHNHDQEFQGVHTEMESILKDTDPKVVWLNYDVAEPYGYGPTAGEFSAAHSRRIAIYHIKNVKRNKQGKLVPAELGMGLVDIKAVVAPLLNGDWEGWLTLERETGHYPHPAPNPEALVRRYRQDLRQLTGV
ncbi:MAG: sugar phosphate isomerase/epimerase family protein [Terriglobia bacterium]